MGKFCYQFYAILTAILIGQSAWGGDKNGEEEKGGESISPQIIKPQSPDRNKGEEDNDEWVQLERFVPEYEKREKELLDKLLTASTHIQTLEEQIKNLTEEKNTLTEEYQEQVRQYGILKEVNGEKNEKIKDLEKQVKLSTDINNVLIKDNDNLKRDRDHYLTQLGDLKENFKLFSEGTKALKREGKDKDNKLSGQLIQLGNLKGQIESLEKEKNDDKEKYQESLKKIETLMEENEKFKMYAGLGKENDSLKIALEKYQTIEQDLLYKLKVSQEENEALQKKLNARQEPQSNKKK